MKFPGNTDKVNCPLTELSRAPPPPLPGGYTVGEQVYFTGTAGRSPNGDKLTHANAARWWDRCRATTPTSARAWP